jgi:hypothetical protein
MLGTRDAHAFSGELIEVLEVIGRFEQVGLDCQRGRESEVRNDGALLFVIDIRELAKPPRRGLEVLTELAY